MSDFNRAVGNLNQHVSQSMTGIGQSMTAIGAGMTRVGQSMTTNLTLPLVAAGGGAAKLAHDWDRSMGQIVSLTNVTGGEIDALGQQILDLAPRVGIGPQELAEAFYFVVSAGFDSAEAMDVLEVSAKAAAAGLGETSTIAQVVGGAVNAFGRENLTASRATDILVKAVGEGTAEAPEFAAALGNVIGSAAAVGATFEDTLAAIAAMTVGGIGAAEATTSLNAVFTTLMGPTTEATEALEGMGLSAAGLRQMIAEQGLLATLQLLDDKFQGNVEATNAVFGNVRALRGVLALTGMDAQQVAGIFDSVAHSVSAGGDAFSQVAETDAWRFRQAMAELQVVGIELGSAVLPVLVDVMGHLANAARGLANWWSSLSDDTKESIVQWGMVLAVAGPVLSIVGKLTSGLGFLFRAIGFLTGSSGIPMLIGKISGLTGPLGLVVTAAIAAAIALDNVAGGPEFRDRMDALKKALEAQGATLDDFAANVRAAEQASGVAGAKIIEFVGDMVAGGLTLEQAWDAAARQFGFNIDSIGLKAAELGPKISGTLTEGKELVRGGADAMAGEIPLAVEDAAAEAERLAALVPGDLSDVIIAGAAELDPIRALIQEILAGSVDDSVALAEAAAELLNPGITAGFQSNSTATKQAMLHDVVEPLIASINTLGPAALITGEGIPTELQAGVFANRDLAIDEVTRLRDEIAPEMDLAEFARAHGLTAVAELIEGMRLNTLFGQQKAAETAGTIGRSMDGSAQAHQGGASTGAGFVGGMVSGTVGNQWKVGNAVSGATATFRDYGWANSAANGGWSVGNAWITNVASAISNKTGTVIAKVGYVAGILGKSLPVTGPLKGDAAEMGGRSVGRSWAEGLADELRMAPHLIANPLGNLGLSPAMLPGGMAGVLPGNPSIHQTHYHLSINGAAKSFERREDFMRELDALGSFGGDGRL
ncbi:MAG: phage tail tape measure protein [Chloroflexi bacterium]|nr:phage tail tape measure protein [Chloroflexota bacterium]